MNQATLIPRTLEKLRTTPHVQFNHFNIVESSKANVLGWHFHNSKCADQDVVISLSNKPLETMETYPPWITLFPLIKFTDVIPSRFMNEDAIGSEMNGTVNKYTIWIFKWHIYENFAPDFEVDQQNQNSGCIGISKLLNHEAAFSEIWEK